MKDPIREKEKKLIKEIKQIAKTNRYKMIGNAVTTKIVELIGTKKT